MENKEVSKGVQKLFKMIVDLEPVEFLGVCQLLGIEVYEGEVELTDAAVPSEVGTDGRPERWKTRVPKNGDQLISEVIDKLNSLNRTRRRNLQKILKPITKGGK